MRCPDCHLTMPAGWTLSICPRCFQARVEKAERGLNRLIADLERDDGLGVADGAR